METKYEPLDQVRKNYRISWYRCPIDKKVLRELTSRSDIRGLFQAVGHLALAGIAAYLAVRFFVLEVWWAFAVSLYAYGIMASFFAMAAIHEVAHKTTFKTKWLNTVFLWIYSALGWFSYPWYNVSHTYHHLYTLHPRGDREVTLPQEPSLRFWYLLQLFTFNITGGFESQGLIPTIAGIIRLAVTGKFASASGIQSGSWLEDIFTPDQDKMRRKAIWFARFVLVIHAAVIAVSIVFRLWPLMIVISLGPFVGNWLRYFVGVPMHCGLRDNVDDFRKCVRTITLDPISSFLYWRMNWHLEHHMYAAVPCYNLKRLYKAVADDMPKPRTLIGAWKEMRETWKRQQVEPSYQFDTPVPSDKSRPPEEQDALEASIGEIAPDTMD